MNKVVALFVTVAVVLGVDMLLAWSLGAIWGFIFPALAVTFWQAFGLLVLLQFVAAQFRGR